jgi:hypothetical protein
MRPVMQIAHAYSAADRAGLHLCGGGLADSAKGLAGAANVCKCADVLWTSGAVYTSEESSQYEAKQAAQAAAEAERRARLRADLSRPLVYLDVAIKGEPIGRMEFVLFTQESPRAAENFRALCTGVRAVCCA